MAKKICLLLLLPLLCLGFFYALSYKIILLIISPLILIFIYINRRNSKLINQTIEECLKVIQSKYELKNMDIGEFKQMTVYGIVSFYSKVYHIEGLGILSILTANLGFMQMFSFVINPYEKDLPQMNYDIIFMLNKRVYLVEIYELMIDNKKEEYKSFLNKIEEINITLLDIENFEVKKNWYTDFLAALIGKKFRTKYDQKFMNLLAEVTKIYIEHSNISKKLEDEDIVKKISLIEEFGNKLIEKGGVSTDTFKRLFGLEKTKKYLGNVLFGYFTFKEISKLNQGNLK